MSRVEPNDDRWFAQLQKRENQPNPRKISRTPDQAEGDEKTVDEALENEVRRGRV
jgi:hypothetical protein